MTQEYPGDHPVENKPKPKLIEALTLQELADLYKINIKTFKLWLEPHYPVIGEKIGRYFSIKQVKLIFQQLGDPPDYQVLLLPLLLPLQDILPLHTILSVHDILHLHDTPGYLPFCMMHNPFCIIHGIA